MDYPFWDPGLPYGLLMAAFAVLHVFVSHFAIGGGLYLVWAERRARRSEDAGALAYVRRLSTFFGLTTIVFGALSGVGIWFIIGLLNPAATEALIHNFVWGWAIEWTFFLVEILAAVLYMKGWDRLSPRAHVAFGWVYFAAAWLSLVVINGIVTFMLTPGRWLETGAFWDGFLNPTYFSSLVLRTAVCVAMAGLFGLLVGAGVADRPLRARLARVNASWGLAGVAATVGAFLWYRADLPPDVTEALGGRLSIPARSLATFFSTSAVLGAGLLGLWALPRAAQRCVAVLLLLAGLLWFGSYEWFRESARKPYVIAGYMYGNGVEVGMAAGYAKTGALAAMPVRTGDDGLDLFRRSCQSCHTLDGYNPVLRALDDTDLAHVEGLLRGLHEMRAKMPPFAGNAAEVKALARWLWERADHRTIAQRYGLSGIALGRKSYEVRCAVCHVAGGWKDKRDKITTFDAGDLEYLLTTELAPEMPVFAGDETERKALVDYLVGWKSEAAK